VFFPELQTQLQLQDAQFCTVISSNVIIYLGETVVQWSEFLATDPEARVRFPALPEKKKWGLERGPLSIVSTTEELLDRKVAAPVYKTENSAVGIRHADHVASSIRKS
jgi:hypothetical protein